MLGLLLVFRTNTAYDRYWEARKLWGTIETELRCLMWGVWVGVHENVNVRTIPAQKKQLMDLFAAFPIALKHHLRGENGYDYHDYIGVLPPSYQTMYTDDSAYPIPLEIINRFTHHFARLLRGGILQPCEWTDLTKTTNKLTATIASLDRIRTTPIPIAYRIHMKQAVLLYCAMLPFTMFDNMGWYSVLLTGIVSFLLFGIDGIGCEIENPFGDDENDLKLDEFCSAVQFEISWMMRWVPQKESVEQALAGGVVSLPGYQSI